LTPSNSGTGDVNKPHQLMEMNSPMDITDAAELFELASVQHTSDC